MDIEIRPLTHYTSPETLIKYCFSIYFLL